MVYLYDIGKYKGEKTNSNYWKGDKSNEKDNKNRKNRKRRWLVVIGYWLLIRNRHQRQSRAIKKLKVDYGTLINEGKKRIKTVAIIGGGGWHSYEIAQKENYDIFISGDIPHHGRRGVVTSKYNFLNVPHEVERIFMPQMEKVLKSINSDFEILSLNHEDLPLLICNKSNCISLK